MVLIACVLYVADCVRKIEIRLFFTLSLFTLFIGSYKNRVTYKPDATIVLKGLTKADEGWYSVNVDFLDGSTIYNKVFLKVTGEC